jgi:hypothetical protein
VGLLHRMAFQMRSACSRARQVRKRPAWFPLFLDSRHLNHMKNHGLTGCMSHSHHESGNRYVLRTNT